MKEDTLDFNDEMMGRAIDMLNRHELMIFELRKMYADLDAELRTTRRAMKLQQEMIEVLQDNVQILVNEREGSGYEGKG